MKGFWGAITLVLAGVIIADLAVHPEGVKAGGTALDQILKTTFSGMLGAGAGPIQ